MSFAAIPIIGKLLEGVFGVIDKTILDKDKALELKTTLQQSAMERDYSWLEVELQERARIIAAEARGESWLQRNWRPIMMLVIVAIVANNYLLAPYLRLIFPQYVTMLELPEHLWNLMTLGVGGYIAGRTVEKGIEAWRK